MFLLILLCAVFLQSHAANDNPLAVMYQRLQEAEKEGNANGGSTFTYVWPFASGSNYLPVDLREKWSDHELKNIKEFMRERNLQHEFGYFLELASNKKLSDIQKIAEQLVCTDYFIQLKNKDQEEKNKALTAICEIHNDRNYSVRRLLLAAGVRSGADVNVRNSENEGLLQKVLIHNDINVVQLALSRGADANQLDKYGNPMLSYCKSLNVVQLMVEHGADAAKALSSEKSIVFDILFFDRSDRYDLLHYYLSYCMPDPSINLGMLITKELVSRDNYYYQKDKFAEHIEILHQHGYYYDDDTQEIILKKAKNISADTKEKTEKIFKDYEVGGKNIKPAKR